MMSFKSRPLPQSVSEPSCHQPIEDSWGSSSANLKDMKVLRSWLVYDSDFPRRFVPGRLNWNLILGLAAVVAVSAGFWAGVGFLVARVWK